MKHNLLMLFAPKNSPKRSKAKQLRFLKSATKQKTADKTKGNVAMGIMVIIFAFIVLGGVISYMAQMKNANLTATAIPAPASTPTASAASETKIPKSTAKAKITPTPLPATAQQPTVKGCTDIKAPNYSAWATKDDGSCWYPVPKLTPTATPTALPAAASTTSTQISGCADPQAINYNFYAVTDNSTCKYLSGCTDRNASNYNPYATRSDYSCQYQQKTYDLFLRTEDVIISPPEIQINQPMTVAVRAQNDGNAAIPNFQAAMFIDNKIISVQSGGQVAALSQADDFIIFSYTPDTTQYGDRQLKILLDPNNNIAEKNEGNNSVIINFKITGPLPDFVLYNYRLAYNSALGGYTATVIAANQGSGSYAGDIDLVLYVSYQYVMNFPVHGLDAGQSKEISQFKWIPPGPGAYNLKIVIDPSHKILESNRNNNETEIITAAGL